jgi:hypothetical protein
VLSERDYMKRPVEPPETSEAQQNPALPPSPKPFNIFEGVTQEPLPPVEGSSAPTGTLVKNYTSNTASSAASSSIENPSASTGRGSAYILIAIVALILGVIIGIVLK